MLILPEFFILSFVFPIVDCEYFLEMCNGRGLARYHDELCVNEVLCTAKFERVQ